MRKWVVSLLALLVALASLAVADVGVFQRTDCSTISSAEAGKTWCFDSTANLLKRWNGSAWETVPTSILTGTVTGTYTLGGTPTLNAPLVFGGSGSLTAPVISGTATGTYTLGGTPSLPTITGNTTWSAGHPVIPSSTLSGLGAAGTAGRLVDVTDSIGGIHKDIGPRWIQIAGGIVNVRERPFGATGNGTTDDTVAIQAAFDTGVKTVVFPEPPTGYVMGEVTISNPGTRIIGLGPTSTTKILLKNASKGFVYKPTSENDAAGSQATIGFEVAYLTITSQNGTQGSHAITIKSNLTPVVNPHHVRLHNLRIMDITGRAVSLEMDAGLTTTAPTNVYIEKLWVRNTGGGVIADPAGDLIYISKSAFRDITGIGVQVKHVPGGATTHISESFFRRNTQEDILVLDALDVAIVRNRFEQDTVVKTTTNKAMIDVQSAITVTELDINHNFMNGNSPTQITTFIRVDRAQIPLLQKNYFVSNTGTITNGYLFTANTVAPLLIGNDYQGPLTNEVNTPPATMRRIADGTPQKTRLPLPDSGTGLELWSEQGNASALTLSADASGNIIFDNVRTNLTLFRGNSAERFAYTSRAGGVPGTISLIRVGATNVMGWASEAPTAGTWTQGDVIWNTSVAAGGSPGFVCTTSGTPGTWKAMANVAA